jgi:hypothetical protein
MTTKEYKTERSGLTMKGWKGGSETVRRRQKRMQKAVREIESNPPSVTFMNSKNPRSEREICETMGFGTPSERKIAKR